MINVTCVLNQKLSGLMCTLFLAVLQTYETLLTVLQAHEILLAVLQAYKLLLLAVLMKYYW